MQLLQYLKMKNKIATQLLQSRKLGFALINCVCPPLNSKLFKVSTNHNRVFVNKFIADTTTMKKVYNCVVVPLAAAFLSPWHRSLFIRCIYIHGLIEASQPPLVGASRIGWVLAMCNAGCVITDSVEILSA